MDCPHCSSSTEVSELGPHSLLNEGLIVSALAETWVLRLLGCHQQQVQRTKSLPEHLALFR